MATCEVRRVCDKIIDEIDTANDEQMRAFIKVLAMLVRHIYGG